MLYIRKTTINYNHYYFASKLKWNKRRWHAKRKTAKVAKTSAYLLTVDIAFKNLSRFPNIFATHCGHNKLPQRFKIVLVIIFEKKKQSEISTKNKNTLEMCTKLGSNWTNVHKISKDWG